MNVVAISAIPPKDYIYSNFKDSSHIDSVHLQFSYYFICPYHIMMYFL